MKKTLYNATHIEGYLYDVDLSKRVTGENSKNPGVEYISGTIKIATDEAKENIVDVHYTYVTPTWGSGKANGNYKILDDMINGKYNTVMNDGDNAHKIRIDSAVALNEFYVEENGEERLVSQKRNEGGFIHMSNEELAAEDARATFNFDMIITGCTVHEADPEQELPERAVLKGAIFNFRQELLPIELMVYKAPAIAYFESLGVSNKNPVFTQLKGQQVSTTIVKNIEETGAWGESSIRQSRRNRKEFVVTWAKGTPYVWDDPSSITVAELAEAQAKRQTYLATVKARQEEYQKNRNSATTASAKDGYDF